MEQRMSIVTLGVKDIRRRRNFYESLGWKASPRSDENIAFFQLGGIAMALYPWNLLAEDVTTKPDGSGFRGVTLAHNVRSREQVGQLLNEAEIAGATIVKPAQDVFWGGHSGYFRDPDGHLWEIAFNPFAELDEEGGFRI